MKLFSSVLLLGAALTCAACGDDSTSGDSATGGGGEGGATSATATTGGDQGGGSAGATTSSGSGGAGPEALALVRGPLFTADLTEAQAYHDQVAAGGEETVKAAGDFAHDALLGTTLLGTTENMFVGIDRWSTDENMDAVYGDPNFQQAFGALFSAPPEFDTFLRAGSFHGWGDLDSADGTEPRYAIVVRGRLADAPSVIGPQHDEVAKGGEEAAKALGDVTHLVYLGRADEREVVLIDLWTNSDAIEAFYSDPAFQAGVGALFEAPPSVGVYASTNWHQW